MVLTENISQQQNFPTANFKNHIMNSGGNSQTINTTETDSLLFETTNTATTEESSTTQEQQQPSLLQFDDEDSVTIKREDIVLSDESNEENARSSAASSSTNNNNAENADMFWQNLKQGSQRFTSSICEKAKEMDTKYKITEKTTSCTENIGKMAVETGTKLQDLYQEHDVGNKVKNATTTASVKAKQFEEKYGICDKVAGAAVGIGAISMARGNVRGGLGALAGAAVFSVLADNMKRKKNEEHELHLS